MSTFCPKCGAMAAGGDRFCGSCGNVLTAATGSAADVNTGAALPGVAAPAAASPATVAATPAIGPTPSVAATPAAASPAETERIEKIYRQVGDFLRAADVKFMENAKDKTYTALYGSAVGVVRITPAGSDDTWVSFLAPVVIGARIQPDLLEYLVRKNADYAATKFHLNASNEIWIQYSMLGSILDAASCKLAIFFTMITADNEDDVIRAKWGGKPASEVLLGTAA